MIIELNNDVKVEYIEQKKFYEECCRFWSGACNPKAGVKFLMNKCNELSLDFNTDPGVRLVMAHIAYLMGLDGLGGVNGAPLLSEQVKDYGQTA
jgi:hypothetical protein